MNDRISSTASDTTDQKDVPLSDDAVSGAQGGYSWNQFVEDLSGAASSPQP